MRIDLTRGQAFSLISAAEALLARSEEQRDSEDYGDMDLENATKILRDRIAWDSEDCPVCHGARWLLSASPPYRYPCDWCTALRCGTISPSTGHICASPLGHAGPCPHISEVK